MAEVIVEPGTVVEVDTPGYAVEVDSPNWQFEATTPAWTFEVVSPETTASISEPATDVDVLLLPGPQGPQGAQGPPGSSFVHEQATPAASWVITHNQNRIAMPVVVLDGAFGQPVYTDFEVIDMNTITLTFPSPVSGYVYL